MSKITQIPQNEWKQFLEDFSARNNDRRARFQIFKHGEVENEGSEYHFEDIELKQDGDSTELVFIRIDRSQSTAHKIKDSVTNVTAIAVQFDTDGSEDVLEVTDKEKELVSLRFESKVDGKS